MGQYARVNMTPYKRVTYSTGGNITQHKNATIYSEGTIEWANNNEFAMLNDLPSTETWTFIVDNGDGTTTEVPKEVYVK